MISVSELSTKKLSVFIALQLRNLNQYYHHQCCQGAKRGGKGKGPNVHEAQNASESMHLSEAQLFFFVVNLNNYEIKDKIINHNKQQINN